MTFLIDAGMVMYWGTARWTPFEIFESYSAVSTFPKIFIFSYTNWTKNYRSILQASILIQCTGGPPLTRKSLKRFPLPRFLAYVRVSGGISVSRGPQYSPTNTNFM